MSKITFEKILGLTFFDKQFINELLHNFNETEFMQALENSCDLNFIVKISEKSSCFNSICRKAKYRPLWNKQFSQLADGFSQVHGRMIKFYEAPLTVEIFNVLKGEFFFLKSQMVRRELQMDLTSLDFTIHEKKFLDKAVEYGSIHAIQRYCRYLYQEEEFIKAIELSKMGPKLYGSYAYMMLAEAYFRYAQSLKENNHIDKAEVFMHCAITSCEEAKKNLAESQYSIHNASFGEGLETSNSWGISNPDEAIALLSNQLECLLAPDSGKKIDNTRFIL